MAARLLPVLCCCPLLADSFLLSLLLCERRFGSRASASHKSDIIQLERAYVHPQIQRGEAPAGDARAHCSASAGHSRHHGIRWPVRYASADVAGRRWVGVWSAARTHRPRQRAREDFSPGIDALAIFAGPQHYISPNWYPGKQEHGKEVPTWNYAVVHAYGPLKIIEDAAWLLPFLTRLTDVHEAASPLPWHVADAPPHFIDAMMKAIVGVELKITRLEGKWKISQNRTALDRQGVKAGLLDRNTPESLKMRSLVEKVDDPDKL